MHATNNDALRITNQFRSKGGMAYDLKCEGVRIALLMVQRTSSADRGEWRVEARLVRTGADTTTTIVEWGETRSDALRAVGVAWSTSNETMGLRVFDWEAVAKVLDAVKAFG